jgi:hypothetical protein
VQTALALARSDKEKVDKGRIETVLELQRKFKRQLSDIEESLRDASMGASGPL